MTSPVQLQPTRRSQDCRHTILRVYTKCVSCWFLFFCLRVSLCSNFLNMGVITCRPLKVVTACSSFQHAISLFDMHLFSLELNRFPRALMALGLVNYPLISACPYCRFLRIWVLRQLELIPRSLRIHADSASSNFKA
ncbi:hypothetical protein BC938DRAFT_481071 [Jimgerdemannia flammicorona]|uniref:Uncharacterized protein n=1 Tax=Jimgerdemannia flammicorona TaxID=994334 RepID=A0A433QH24_9FUNG|nr:hypothetical protein BC938DRAFT_481071 [Jimgerdemannia flammicorona]